MATPRFSLSQDDWSLHRKGQQDQARHQEKVREAIRQNLPDIISEEGLIMTDGKNIMKIPIRSLEEYHFRYHFDKSDHAGQGQGNSKVGDVLGKDKGNQADAASGAGDRPGIDYYEVGVSIDEIAEVMFADFELPNLEEKSPDLVTSPAVDFKDVRKTGLQGNIEKKRTLLEAMKRNALSGKPTNTSIHLDDLRYKTWEDMVKPESQAVVIAMMDTSGSMGTFEKYIARTFFFWMVRFLRSKYQNVKMEFIAHHTEAKRVSEAEFFSKGESGGTICSSAYQMALDLVHTEYPPDRYNVYPFHFSDGDNLTSDNERCVQLVNELMEECNVFGYGEINQYRCTAPTKNIHKLAREKRDKRLYHKGARRVTISAYYKTIITEILS